MDDPTPAPPSTSVPTPPRRWTPLQCTALLSSLTIAAIYVGCYRRGGDAPAPATTPTPTPAATPTNETTPPPPAAQPEYFPGSKSGAIVRPRDALVGAKPAAVNEPIDFEFSLSRFLLRGRTPERDTFGGSKSAVVFDRSLGLELPWEPEKEEAESEQPAKAPPAPVSNPEQRP